MAIQDQPRQNLISIRGSNERGLTLRLISKTKLELFKLLNYAKRIVLIFKAYINIKASQPAPLKKQMTNTYKNN